MKVEESALARKNLHKPIIRNSYQKMSTKFVLLQLRIPNNQNNRNTAFYLRHCSNKNNYDNILQLIYQYIPPLTLSTNLKFLIKSRCF